MRRRVGRDEFPVKNQKHAGERRADDDQHVETDMELRHVAVEQHEHRQDDLDSRRPVAEGVVVEHPDEVRIVGERVGGADEEVNQEHVELPMVPQPHAVAGKHAVMVALHDANAARVAMPGAGRNDQLALLTQAPVLRRWVRLEPRAGHQFVGSKHAGVDQDDGQKVPDDVEHEEGRANDVRVEQPRVAVDGRENHLKRANRD